MCAGDHDWRDHARGDVVIRARVQVMTAAALVMLAVVAFRAPGGPAGAVEATLPYYDEATFTPHWTTRRRIASAPSRCGRTRGAGSPMPTCAVRSTW